MLAGAWERILHRRSFHPKPNQRAYDQNLYAHRNKVERLFGRLKKARFATRHEKTVTSFLAVAHLLAALDWLR